MIGETISHYKIIEKLGEGGMGVVYKAEHLKLGSNVALKFLPHELSANEAAKTRFIREAKAASALEHPNICAVYDIDETPDGRLFMVMPCYEGETLRNRLERGPLEIDKALALAVQVASGLGRAHEKGIVHRDIKPGNVMLTDEGRHATLMDFGLAKKLDTTRMTQTGMTVGTVAYMSPEQALGKETDGRTDVWSLGVMLYEMLTGRPPFRGDVEPAMIYSIINEEPELVTSVRKEVPAQVETLIEKALTKDVAKRYPGMEELLKDLEEISDQLALGIKERRFRTLRKLKRRKRLVTGTVAVAVVVLAVVLIRTFYTPGVMIDSVAVLPFDNLSGDEEQEYLSDGMTEALITELSKIGALRVISRTSAMLYKETNKPLPQIARELDVNAVVEGSVLRVGKRVRITAQLIGAAPERHLWADNYDRDFGDILILSSEVARAIAHEIQVTLTPEEQARLTSARPVNPKAHELYLKGKSQYYTISREGIKKANEYFQQAIEVDPNHAQAYAGLAASYELQAYFDLLPLDEAKAKIDTLVRKALEIDPTLAEAYLALSGKRFYLDWDWLGGEEEIKRAIELNPGLAEAHYEYAYFLAAMGRFEEAIAEAKLAFQLDPLSLLYGQTLASIYRLSRQYNQSINQYQKLIEMEPNEPGVYGGLAKTYEAMGRYEDAVKAKQKALTLWGAPHERIAALDSVYSESGPKGYWMWHLERLKGQFEHYPQQTAGYYAQLGEKDQAFAWLEKAYEKHGARRMFLLKVNQSWDSLRSDPRFDDLLRRMNFPK